MNLIKNSWIWPSVLKRMLDLIRFLKYRIEVLKQIEKGDRSRTWE